MRMRASNLLPVLLFPATLLFGCAGPGEPTTPDALMAQSASTVDDLRAHHESFDYFLTRSKAVLVFPRIIRGGLMVGGGGGTGVLVERGTSGSWNETSFYSAGGLSFGAQAGVETAKVAVVIMNERLIQSLRAGSLDFGVGVSLAVGPADLRAAQSLQTFQDAYVFRDAAGAYAGVSLDGVVVSRDKALNATHAQGPGAGEAEAALQRAIQPPQP